MTITTTHRAALGDPFQALDRDWEQCSRRARAALARWRAGEPGPFDQALTLDEVLASVRDGDFAAADVILAALLRLGDDGDEAANRTLVQIFVPLAAAVTRLWSQPDRDRAEVAAEVLAVLVEQLARYDLERRPSSIAAHVAWGVRRTMHHRLGRRRLVEVPLDDDRQHGGGERREASGHVASIVTTGVHRGRLNRDQARLMLLVAAGHNVAQIARERGHNRVTMWRQLQRAVAAVAPVAA